MLTHVAQTLRPHYHGVAGQPHSAYLLHTGVSEQTGVHREKLRGATIPEDPLSFIHWLPLGFKHEPTNTNGHKHTSQKCKQELTHSQTQAQTQTQAQS
jgi:hypothetical protein